MDNIIKAESVYMPTISRQRVIDAADFARDFQIIVVVI